MHVIKEWVIYQTQKLSNNKRYTLRIRNKQYETTQIVLLSTQLLSIIEIR